MYLAKWEQKARQAAVRISFSNGRLIRSAELGARCSERQE